MEALLQFVQVAYPYIQQVYLTQAATCSQGASSELLLSSATSHNLYRGYHYIKYRLPAGPMRPSSHDLPWLSKPLVCPIYSTLTSQYQGIHPTLSQTLCNTHITIPPH